MGITDGKITIGSYYIPERKKPIIGIKREDGLYVYGTFKDEECAVEFMKELGKLIGVYKEDEYNISNAKR